MTDHPEFDHPSGLPWNERMYRLLLREGAIAQDAAYLVDQLAPVFGYSTFAELGEAGFDSSLVDIFCLPETADRP